MDDFLFHRSKLADELVDIVLGRNVLAGNTGLFLAAPRRTGKSTFLREDLMPALHEAGVLPVYVDLWSDKKRDPSDLVAEAFRTAARETAPALIKATRRSGLRKIGLGSWLSFDVDSSEAGSGSTLTEVIGALVESTERPVVLIMDEAQHAVTTEAGANMMFALKSARDTLNIGAPSTYWGNVRLGLAFTGSNRDRLSAMVMSKSQPFFGSRVTTFPLLGRDYTDAFTAFLNERLSPARRLDPDEMYAAFERVGHRPQLLMAAVQATAFGVLGSTHAKRTLADEAREVNEGYWHEFEESFADLTPLQQAVIARIVETGTRFRPFEGASLASYSAATGGSVGTSDVQSALDALRVKGLVLRQERGGYVLEDPAMAEWYETRIQGATEDEPLPFAP